jgi:hypothetical protein
MKKSLVIMIMITLLATLAQSGVLQAVLANHESISQDSSPSSVLDHIAVRHIHDSGWSSHPLQLVVTPDSLLIRGDSEFRDNMGGTRYCTFPADILLEQVVKVEAKRGSASFLGIVRLTKLHLEFKDEKGKHHTYDFVSQDASQSNNEWYEGPERGKDLLRFAQVAQNAVGSRLEAVQHPLPANRSAESIPSASDGSDPIPVGEATPSGQFEPAGSSSAPADVAKNGQYDLQVVGTTMLYPVVVSSPSAIDPNMLLITWKESHGNNIVALGDILAVKTEQRSLSFNPSAPGTIFEFHMGGPMGPKLYVLSLEVRGGGGKKFTYRIVSDEAVCNGTAPCKDGADNGQHVLDLARTIKAAIASHAESVMRGTIK